MNRIVNAVTRVGHRSLLVTKKHSPVILTTVGILGGVTAAVLGAKATLKLEPIVADLELDLENHNQLQHDDEGEKVKTTAQIYAVHTIRIIKLYGPSVSLGAASIVCIVSAQGIMQKRNAALGAAYLAMEKGFTEYRKRVEEALGTEKENELRYGIKTEELHDTKAGTVTEVKTPDPNAYSPYAIFFDQFNKNWKREGELNKYFLQMQQNYANDMLRARGHVFLNEVYDMIGAERTKAGAVVGWVLSSTGDNFIDFGIFNAGNERARMFVNGLEAAILLDFNVDGVIFDKI